MQAKISKINVSADGREILIVCVKDGGLKLGVCEIGSANRANDPGAICEAFHIGSDPIVKMISPDYGNPHEDKLMVQIYGAESSDPKVMAALTLGANSCFNDGVPVETALDEILPFLYDGLYAVYTTRYFPSDGSGDFFWDAYTVNRAVKGTAMLGDVSGATDSYTPCFLIPTKSPARFKYHSLQNAVEKIKAGGTVAGIAYHYSGQHAFLLKGHHCALAALSQSVDFNCITIEPLNRFVKNPDDDRITAIAGVSAELPFSILPPEMLETALMARRGISPPKIETIRKNMSYRRMAIRKGYFPKEFLSKLETLPDTEMIRSAQSVSSLSPQQLEALLTGNTYFEGKVIISPNYYQSIITASNYLQYTDNEQFMDFAVNIIYNQDLSAVHEYVANRLLRIHHKKIYDLFAGIIEDNLPAYAKIKGVAARYLKKYDLIEKEAHDNSNDITIKRTTNSLLSNEKTS